MASSMKKTTAKRKTPSPAPQASRKAPQRPRETRDVALSMAAVVIAVWARAAWLTPLLLAAPFAFYLAKGAAADREARMILTRRWSITIFVTMMAATVFAPPQTLHAVPFAAGVPNHIDAWLHHGGAPPLGARFMLVAGLAALVFTVASAGIAGAIILAAILALNAASATILISRGYNIVQMAIVAVPPWQWCFMIGLIALMTPLSVFSRARILNREGAPFVWDENRTQILVGAGLVVLAFILRFALAGPYSALVRHWTL
jgi:hypothetical protein